MRPEDYVFGLGSMIDLGDFKRIALRSLGGGCDMTSAPTPKPPIATSTRMKGAEITELRRVVIGHKPGNVLLELSPEGAEVLAGLLGSCVTGSDAGPRGVLQTIYASLSNAGVKARNYSYAGRVRL